MTKHFAIPRNAAHSDNAWLLEGALEGLATRKRHKSLRPSEIEKAPEVLLPYALEVWGKDYAPVMLQAALQAALEGHEVLLLPSR